MRTDTSISPPSNGTRYVVWVCAVISLAFVAVAGRTSPIVLAVLFCGWVVLPFAGLTFLQFRAQPTVTGKSVNAIAVILSLSSVAFYSWNAVKPLPTARAFPYLMWPAFSWLVIGSVSVWMMVRVRRPLD